MTYRTYSGDPTQSGLKSTIEFTSPHPTRDPVVFLRVRLDHLVSPSSRYPLLLFGHQQSESLPGIRRRLYKSVPVQPTRRWESDPSRPNGWTPLALTVDTSRTVNVKWRRLRHDPKWQSPCVSTTRRNKGGTGPRVVPVSVVTVAVDVPRTVVGDSQHEEFFTSWCRRQKVTLRHTYTTPELRLFGVNRPSSSPLPCTPWAKWVTKRYGDDVLDTTFTPFHGSEE